MGPAQLLYFRFLGFSCGAAGFEQSRRNHSGAAPLSPFLCVPQFWPNGVDPALVLPRAVPPREILAAGQSAGAAEVPALPALPHADLAGSAAYVPAPAAPCARCSAEAMRPRRGWDGDGDGDGASWTPPARVPPRVPRTPRDATHTGSHGSPPALRPLHL